MYDGRLYMFKRMYLKIDRLPWTSQSKFNLSFFLTGILFSLCSVMIWLIIRRWALDSWDWMLCFMGYPFIIAWFTVLLLTCSNDFHNGSFPE